MRSTLEIGFQARGVKPADQIFFNCPENLELKAGWCYSLTDVNPNGGPQAIKSLSSSKTKQAVNKFFKPIMENNPCFTKGKP